MHSLPDLAEKVRSFALIPGEDKEANKTLTFAFELAAGAERPADIEATRERFLDRLKEVNQDYREAARFIPRGKEPTLEFHALGEGRFAGYDIRLNAGTYSRTRADRIAHCVRSSKGALHSNDPRRRTRSGNGSSAIRSGRPVDAEASPPC